MGIKAVVEVSPTQFESKSLLVRMGGWVVGGWVVDKKKIMLSQLQTEVELKSELSLAIDICFFINPITIWESQNDIFAEAIIG